MIPQFSFYQHRPTYSGVPIEDYQNAFATSAKAYDTNLENYNILKSFGASIKALPQDSEYVAQKLDADDKAIANIADQVTGSQRWDLAGSALQRMKASYNADPKLNAIRESYLNFNKGEELKQEMRSAGKTPLEINDPVGHKTIDANGNVNIFRPNVVPKADYVQAAQDIIADIAPDIVSLDLQPSEVAGILEGKVIKGMSREKLLSRMADIKSTYDNTDEGTQHKWFIQKNSPDRDPDEFISNFLFSVGNIRTFKETKTDRMPDPSYVADERTRHIFEAAQAKLAIKQAKGSSKYDPEFDGVLHPESLRAIDSGVVDKATGKNKLIKSNALMLSNAEIVKDYSDTRWVGDGSNIVPLNKNETFNFEDTAFWGNNKHDILDYKIKGFALDEENGKGTLGGAIAELKYFDHDSDKEKKMNVILKTGDEEFKNLFATNLNVIDTIKKHNQGNTKSIEIPDVSGLLGAPGVFGFFVSGDNRIRPTIKKPDGTSRLVREDELQRLSLKQFYDTKDIQDLTTNQIGQALKPYTQTNSDLQKN